MYTSFAFWISIFMIGILLILPILLTPYITNICLYLYWLSIKYVLLINPFIITVVKVKKSTQRLNSFKIQCCFLLIRIKVSKVRHKKNIKQNMFCILIHYHSIIYNSNIKVIYLVDIVFHWRSVFCCPPPLYTVHGMTYYSTSSGTV